MQCSNLRVKRNRIFGSLVFHLNLRFKRTPPPQPFLEHRMNKCIIDSSIECDIQMISLDKDFVAGDVVIPMGTPVPVQFTDKTMSQGSIGTESLAAGLIKVLADGCYTDRRKQYKALLLAIQPDSAKELTLAGIAQSQKANHAFAQTLFKAVIALTGSADAYINLALAYAKEVAELQKAGKIEEAEKVEVLN